MYNDQKYYEKDPSKMTEEEAKQAVAYWRGRHESKDNHICQPCPLPHYPTNPRQPDINVQPFHYHDGTVCYKNPCTWC